MTPDRPWLRWVTVLLLSFAPAGAAAGSTPTFYNVLAPDGADPWVYRHGDGVYYMTFTTATDIRLWRSDTLSGIAGGESKVVWTPPAAGPCSQHIWAPELHYLGGKWYLYFAADDGRNESHRMYVLENDNPDPLEDKFVARGKIFDPGADKWAIDGTVLKVAGKLYLIWSGWEGDVDGRQNLYIAPMKNPYTLGGPRVEISRPTMTWETTGRPHVNEGPETLIRGQTINLIYSAGPSWTDDCCLGLLTAKLDSDLLSAASWKKQDRPVFRSGNGILAPGHASFVKSSDEKEDWIVYHAARFAGAGWARNIRTQPFAWRKDGTPNFGSPLPANLPIRLPGGEPAHERFEAEQGKLGGCAKAIRHADASGGAKVGFLCTPDSYVELTVNVPNSAKFTLAVRFANGTPDRKDASHRLSLNGAELGQVRYSNSGWDNWSSAFQEVQLQRGDNTIRFSKGKNLAEIDCIDIFPRSFRAPH